MLVRPEPLDEPPQMDGEFLRAYGGGMRRVCTNRHHNGVNILFMDWSMDKVRLKQLWTLKWHRTFDTTGPWTLAGNVGPDDWPPWMPNF